MFKVVVKNIKLFVEVHLGDIKYMWSTSMTLLLLDYFIPYFKHSQN